MLQVWPAFVLTDRFFDRTIYSDEAIAACLAQCHAKLDEVTARIARVKEFHAVIARKRHKDTLGDKKQRHDVEIFELLDEFHGGKTKLEADDVYAQVLHANDMTNVDSLDILDFSRRARDRRCPRDPRRVRMGRLDLPTARVQVCVGRVPSRDA